MKTKVCTRCRKRKALTVEAFAEFEQDGHYYFSSRCRQCLCKAAGEVRQNEPARFAVYWRRSKIRRYGSDPERYERLFEQQKGRCAGGHRATFYSVMKEQAGRLICARCLRQQATA